MAFVCKMVLGERDMFIVNCGKIRFPLLVFLFSSVFSIIPLFSEFKAPNDSDKAQRMV